MYLTLVKLKLLSLFEKHCSSRYAGFWLSHMIRIHTFFHTDWKYIKILSIAKVISREQHFQKELLINLCSVFKYKNIYMGQ